MDHRFAVLTEQDEIERWIAPIMRELGSEIPAPGCGVVFVEFDAAGVVAFQILQNALFAEGLYARDGSAHLRTLCNMMLKWVAEKFGETAGKQLLTMTRSDQQGERIGRAARYMGFEETGFKVYRRKI